MSYTATNLLFDMGPGAPVQDEEVDSHWVTDCACGAAGSDTTKRGHSFGDAESAVADSCSVAKADGGSAGSAFGAAGTNDAEDVALSLDCTDAADNLALNKAARQSSQSEDCEAHSEVSRRSAGNGGDDSPPFLMYKWPKGLRGWSIIALLIGQAGPCIAILAMLVIGKVNNMPELYLVDSGELLGRYNF
jgi:hypothetical protein